MLIEQLKLENIGAYRGSNVFDLSIKDPKKNVILIGGENGAGKTTFLNSIKLGLFGCYSYGYKTENPEYYKRVYSYLNTAAKKEENEHFSVTISFSEVENYRRHIYKLQRSWQIKDRNVKETLTIQKDGSYLGAAEKDIYVSKLREYFPPKLFDLCLFDGEEIARIISEDKLSSYLKELSTVIFNLDLFKSLQMDLSVYLQQQIDANQLSSIETEIVELQQQEKTLTASIENTQKSIENSVQRKHDLEETYSVLKKDFETHGGLVKEQREKLNRKVLDIETDRRYNSEKVREFVQALLPFYMNRGLLLRTSKHMQEEEQLTLFNQLALRLTEEKTSAIVQSLSGISSTVEIVPILRTRILESIQPELQTTYIHRASPAEQSQVETVVQLISQEDHNVYLQLLEQNRTKLKEAQDLRQKINLNDAASEFSQMLSKMEEIKLETFQLEKDIEEKVLLLEELQQNLSSLQSTISSKQSIVEQSNRTQNSFMIAQNIMKLSSEFQKLQHQKKLQQVQIEAMRMLNKLMRKHQYISSLRINSETFEVTLYDRERENIAKETLSAGEKEILLLSLIWAMFKCSGRRVPFIFDTLLGRLDKTHKQNILRDFIPSCGEQVLILATNSEVDHDHYEILSEYVAQRYLLQFNTEERRTTIASQYFNFRKEEPTA